MSKTFHTYVKKYQVMRPERMYGEFRKYTESEFTTYDSSIYFIVKCKAVQWLPNTFVVGENYTLQGQLLVDGVPHKVFLNMAAFWYSMQHLQKKFSTMQEMSEYFMTRSKPRDGQTVSNAEKYQRYTSIDFAASDTEKLVIECELCRNMNREGSAQTNIYAYQAINFFDLPGPVLDVMYIGSSVSNPFNRLLKHDKWGQLQAEKKRHEDLLVYFGELEGDAFRHESVKGISLLVRNDHGVSTEDETFISEMALINYFKPPYNKLHKDRDIGNTQRVERVLKSAGFNEVAVEVILEGPLGALGTTHTNKYGSHTAIHKIA